MTRTCERTARGIALIKPLLDSSHYLLWPSSPISSLPKLDVSYILTNVRGGGGRGDFVGLKVFNRIFSRFQKDFQGLLESALDV